VDNILTECPALAKTLGIKPYGISKTAARKIVKTAHARTVIGEALEILTEVKNKHHPAEAVLAGSWGWCRYDSMPTGDRAEALRLMGFVKSTAHAGWFYRPGLDAGWGKGKSIEDIFKTYGGVSI
jgi:hypothetical protein